MWVCGKVCSRIHQGKIGEIDCVKIIFSLFQRDYLFATGKTHTVKFVVEVVFGFAGLDWTKWVKADPSMARVDDLTALSVDVSPSRSRLQWHECRPLEDTLWDMFEHDCASMSVTPPLRKSNK